MSALTVTGATAEETMRLLIALLLGLGWAAAPAPAKPRADRIDAIVTSQMQFSNIPGAAVAVIERGRIIKLTSYGLANLEWDRPVTLDTRFQLASATKIFT